MPRMGSLYLQLCLLLQMTEVHSGCKWSESKRRTVCEKKAPVHPTSNSTNIGSDPKMIMTTPPPLWPPEPLPQAASQQSSKFAHSDPALAEGVRIAELYHSPACAAARNVTSYRNLQRVCPWASQEARVMETGGLNKELWPMKHARPRTVYIR